LKFHTGCNNQPYFFKAGFVVKKTGVFTLEPGALVSPCPDKKADVPSSFIFTFDLADCNKDVWLSVRAQSLSGLDSYVDPDIDTKRIFVFKVQ